MNLTQVNDLWDQFKQRYDIDPDIRISDIRYDTPENVEGSFDLFELLEGKYVLHLNPRFHLYNENYVKFVLFHEFTHFYDFIKCEIEDQKDFFIYMNAYSEYHACRVTLARFIEQLTVKTFDIDKIQIPGPFKEISARKLITEALYRVKYSYLAYLSSYDPADFVATFRQLMYLYGYLSLFEQDELMVKQSLEFLDLTHENYFNLFLELKEEEYDIDKILECTRAIYNDAFLLYIREFIRRNYDEDLYDEEDLENLTPDNYREYIEDLEERQEEFDFSEAAFETHFYVNYGHSLFSSDTKVKKHE